MADLLLALATPLGTDASLYWHFPLLVILVNLTVDISYSFLDPRVTYE